MTSNLKTHNEIDYVLTFRRRHSNIFHTRPFRVADCDADHYLLIIKLQTETVFK